MVDSMGVASRSKITALNGQKQVWRQKVSYSKYKNKKVYVDGLKFDSKKEAVRWQELKILQRAGEIEDLERQVKYEIIPKCGKEMAAHYTADFVYRDARSKMLVVEDVKSAPTRTQDYILRRKLMNKIYGIQIREV